MAIVNIDNIDYLSQARERPGWQFEERVVFDKYLQLLINQQQELEEVFTQLLQLRSVDEAEGAQLDIIGEIVGQPRELISTDLFTFFGFQGAIKADTFGDLNNPSVGGLFYNFGTALGGNTLLPDDLYRLFIKAKIFKNNTNATPEEFISFMSILFGDIPIAISEGPEAQFIVMIGRALSAFEQALLNYVSTANGYPSRLIPKPVGVGIGFGSYQENNYFGFQGVAGAKGFGEFVGTFGYGLGYGIGYGDSDFSNSGGGYFATLF